MLCINFYDVKHAWHIFSASFHTQMILVVCKKSEVCSQMTTYLWHMEGTLLKAQATSLNFCHYFICCFTSEFQGLFTFLLLSVQCSQSHVGHFSAI